MKIISLTNPRKPKQRKDKFLGCIYKYTNYTKEELFCSGIYTITNTVNNKIYVGSAVCFYDRLRIHIGDLINNTHHNSYLQNAVNKYGIENFKFEILEECDKSIMRGLEKYWMNMLNVLDANCGYNINSDTSTRLGAKLSDNTINKIKKSLTGRKISLEQKIINTKAIRKSKGKSVIRLDLNNNFIKEYECLNDAAKELQIDCTNIVAQLKGKGKTCQDSVFVYKNEYDVTKDYSIKKGKSRNIVIQYDMNMNFIQEFENSTEAAKSVNGNPLNINNVCRTYTNGFGKDKSYKNYIWKNKEENKEEYVDSMSKSTELPD